MTFVHLLYFYPSLESKEYDTWVFTNRQDLNHYYIWLIDDKKIPLQLVQQHVLIDKMPFHDFKEVFGGVKREVIDLPHLEQTGSYSK